MTLMATSRSKAVRCLARYTSAMPPLPTRSIISYAVFRLQNSLAMPSPRRRKSVRPRYRVALLGYSVKRLLSSSDDSDRNLDRRTATIRRKDNLIVDELGIHMRTTD